MYAENYFLLHIFSLNSDAIVYEKNKSWILIILP